MDIVINSSGNEPSTDEVLNWLYYMGQNPMRLNDVCTCQSSTVLIEDGNIDFKLTAGGRKINLTDIGSYWYRRGELNLLPSWEIENELFYSAFNYYKKEINHLVGVIDNIGAAHHKSLNKFSDNDTNKLINLVQASKLGLRIPPTIITNSRQDLEQFIDKYDEIIMKPIALPGFEAYHYATNTAAKVAVGTVKIASKNIHEYLDAHKITQFVPTLFQGYIDKKYEIRSFFIDGVFYSMAIFSQANEKTKDDFRRYDYERPNRVVPYTLPAETEEKLCRLMKKIDMNCGSFDIIVTPQLEYIFLEVNPVGQFQWLSKNCNYFIERRIAQILCL